VCPLPADVDTSDLVVRPLGDEPLRIVARAGHPLARRHRVTAAELVRLPWIVQTPGSPLRRDVDAMLSAAGQRLPRNVVETVSVVATLALLEDGNAVTAMPKALADHYARHGIVVPIPVDLRAPASRYELVTRARRELSPAARAFVTMLGTDAARAAVRRSRR
jgi:DNA-binding transcriptional LysR family regulator